MRTLSSAQNPNIKKLIKLREKRTREKTQTFLIEGGREISRALEGKKILKELYFCPDFFSKENEKLFPKIKDIPLFHCTPSLFRKISYREEPDGLLAVAPTFNLSLKELSFHSQTPLMVITESIEKPGNLGAILRSCDATAIDGLIVTDPLTDIFHPNVIRASMGSLFTIPIVQAKKEEAYNWLKKHSISLLATTPHAKKAFTQANLKVPLALAVGTESTGLSDFWMKKADLQVRIPMLGIADSLNVATATTLLLYETLRQRRII